MALPKALLESSIAALLCLSVTASAQVSNVEGLKPLEGVTIPKVSSTQSLAPVAVFKDCNECPEMVVIPAGQFVMGAAPGEEERENSNKDLRNLSQPQHRVGIERFAVGKFEVTVAQYKAFVRATGRKSEGCWVWTGATFEKDLAKDWRNPGYAQDERHPVACISWDDASSYVAWLSHKTGKSYRLLTEAEWEYAARAGTTAARFWGEDGNQSCGFANSADQATGAQVPFFAQVPGWNYLIANCNDGFAYTAPVGSYRANGFGLHDMLGNVNEWTQDCWNENYNGAPTDGSEWTTGDCSLRVARGGSWSNVPLGSAKRIRGSTASRDFNVGFRVAISTRTTGDAEKSQGSKSDDGYGRRVAALIKSNTVLPPLHDISTNPPVIFEFQLLPDGSPREITLVKSSGIGAFDEAVKRAIEKTLFPPDPASGKVPSDRIVLKYRPKD